MNLHAHPELDLMPPPFAEGLDDWSRGDGTPDSPTYAAAENARLVRGDADFGICLELRTTAPVARLRYMGELPLLTGAFVEVSVRVKALRGPLPRVQVAGWPGALGGKGVPDLPVAGPDLALAGHETVAEVRAVIGREAQAGVDLVWDLRALYGHVGIDLLGPPGAVVRIENLAVRDVTRRFTPQGRVLPGFEDFSRA